jgi:hypothetical protein
MLTPEQMNHADGGTNMSKEARARVRAVLAQPVWPSKPADESKAAS